MPGDDGESKGAHDDPLAIEHLEERLHKEERRRGKCWKRKKKHLDEEPDVALFLLHLWAAAVRWTDARHGCRGFFSTSTHVESS